MAWKVELTRKLSTSRFSSHAGVPVEEPSNPKGYFRDPHTEPKSVSLFFDFPFRSSVCVRNEIPCTLFR